MWLGTKVKIIPQDFQMKSYQSLRGAWPSPQHIKCKEPRKLREEAEEREQVRVWQTRKVLKSVLPRFPAEEAANQEQEWEMA